MTNSNDEAHTPHTPGSQPSVRPGSDEPQTITAPTPPVAWNSGPANHADLANEEDEPERFGTDEESKTAPQED